ncbi:CDP-alcohol phosphatidyltransferase family protein [Chloroflexi bacterium TSY]|nr:CDP-alcohol phosphatidyltransferase family protein [Chloroflexi bacterium TSY]
MRDSILREQKDKYMLPVAEQLFSAIHPNVVSFVALGVGLLCAAATINGAFGLGLLLWLLNRVLDGLDGLVARVHHKQSDFGGYLDLLLDFIVYLAVPIALIYALPTSENLWGGLVLLSSYILNLLSWSTLSALIEKRQIQTSARLTSMEMPTGLIEGAETILFYVLFFLFPSYLAPLLWLMAVLVLVTASQRVWWAYYNL